jgi:hypothetical protein
MQTTFSKRSPALDQEVAKEALPKRASLIFNQQ